MLDDAFIFSNNQAITISAASNYAGTGFGSAGAGVFDTGTLVPSPPGTQAQYGGIGVFGGAVTKFTLIVTVGIPFVGPVGSTLYVGLQDSALNTTDWLYTDITDYLVENLASLQIPGQVIISQPLPAIGGSTNPPGALRQYLRMYYTVAGGPFTAGTLNARVDIM